MMKLSWRMKWTETWTKNLLSVFCGQLGVFGGLKSHTITLGSNASRMMLAHDGFPPEISFPLSWCCLEA